MKTVPLERVPSSERKPTGVIMSKGPETTCVPLSPLVETHSLLQRVDRADLAQEHLTHLRSRRLSPEGFSRQHAPTGLADTQEFC